MRTSLPTFALAPAIPSPPRRPRPTLLRAPSMSSRTPIPPPLLSPSSTLLHPLSTQTILLTGATGLIGRHLISTLRKTKARIHILARDPPAARALFVDPSLPPVTVTRYDATTATLSDTALQAVADADVVVNLAGEPVEQGRWTTTRKKQLWDSRVRGTESIVSALRTCPKPPVLISASAVGYYGTSETATFDETHPSGKDFLAVLASAWENAAQANSRTSRTVILRIGVVLASDGGAFDKIGTAFRYFLGGPPGDGMQWFSWVHVDDLVRLILHACVEDKWNGVYNATAPQPVRLREFCNELGKAMGRPSWLPVPGQAIKAMLGNEAAQLILKGQRVLPKRVRENGFVYQYKDVGSALRELVSPGRSRASDAK